MGISAQQLLQSDPEYLQRQLAQQEMQRLNPTGGAAGAIGALLGRGVSNLAGGRGFFDVNDAGLRRVADVQRIMSSAQFDPNNPAAYYESIAKGLQSAGYGDLAPMAAQEAFKYNQQAKAETRAERALVLSEESAKDTRYKNNPELLLRDALALPEEDPTRTALLTRYSDIVKDKNYSTAKQEADLAKAKADLAKTQAETARIRAITASEETDAQGARVNNNGVRIGKFDKVGRYRSPEGKTYTAKAMETAQAEHDTTSDLIYKLEQVTDDDIKNAFGSATDWTTVPGGGLIANKNTYNAQTKINAIQIQSVLNNLSKLKGPSSDKEMGQMIKDFPGYNAPPDVMRNWMNRATEAANRFLKRSESRYGFDTDYGTEKRFSTEKKPAEKATGTRTRTTRGGVTYTVED
jgi:hypothetical protein